MGWRAQQQRAIQPQSSYNLPYATLIRVRALYPVLQLLHNTLEKDNPRSNAAGDNTSLKMGLGKIFFISPTFAMK